MRADKREKRLREAERNIKVIQSIIMGYKNIETTMETYLRRRRIGRRKNQ